MTGITVSYRLEPRRSRRESRPEPPKATRGEPRRGDRTARLLALAHHIEWLVDDGVIPDYAAAARKLGLTSARMTQIVNLLLLAPEIQERLLRGTLNIHERGLRTVLRIAEWTEQQAQCALPISRLREQCLASKSDSESPAGTAVDHDLPIPIDDPPQDFVGSALS